MKSSKIKSLSVLMRTLNNLRSKRSRVVFTNGCFDILHCGHISILQKARKQGDILVIGLNSDKSVRSLKGRGRPVNSQKDRAYVLAALECVNFITIFKESTPLRLIKLIKPDVLVKGGDWPVDKIIGADIVRSYGGKVICLPYIKDRSTTGIIAKVNSL